MTPLAAELGRLEEAARRLEEALARLETALGGEQGSLFEEPKTAGTASGGAKPAAPRARVRARGS